MKRIGMFFMVGLFALSLAGFGTSAWGSKRAIIRLGADGEFTGGFCCVKDTCVVAKNEADCKKIGGVKIKNCKECVEAAAPNN